MINRNIAILLSIFFVPNVSASIDSGDTAWILTSTALVLFMTYQVLHCFMEGW